MSLKDIPEELTSRLRRLRDEYPHMATKQFRYPIAAALVLRHYLGSNPLNMKDPFVAEGDQPERLVRIQIIGDLLFSIRSCKGFQEFCRRLQGRFPQFRSAFFEVFAANAFAGAGFELLAKPETGIKKEDFDFQAARRDLVVNVEVTALTSDTFAATNVRNALDAKRKQLPDTEPAVVWCVLPESWNSVADLESELANISDRFFAGTRRINAVLFCMEQIKGPFGRENIWTYRYPCFVRQNRNPRISVDLDFLGEHPFLVSQNWGDPSEWLTDPTVLAVVRGRDFYTWTDFVLDSPGDKPDGRNC